MKKTLVLLLLAVPRPALAEGSQAAAQALFDDARRLMSAGDVARACPKLAESQRLDPSGGTLLHLAACHEREGRTATAWAEFHEAVSVARRDGRADREAAARSHVAAIEKVLSRVTVLPPSPRPNGFEVRLDGRPIGDAQFGVAIPLDPGRHEIAASADGFKPRTTTIDVAPGPASVAFSVPPLAIEERPPPPRRSEASDRPWARRTGLVVGAIGLVGLGAGGVTGATALADKSTVAAHCAGSHCDDAGFAAQRDARSFGAASTIAFAAGAAFLAAGAVLFFVVGKRPAPADTAAFLF